MCQHGERERDCLKSKKKERLWSPYKERAGDLEKTDVETCDYLDLKIGNWEEKMLAGSYA